MQWAPVKAMASLTACFTGRLCLSRVRGHFGYPRDPGLKMQVERDGGTAVSDWPLA